MSIVLDALQKAEREKNQGGVPKLNDIKVHEVKSYYKKTLNFILIFNLVLISFVVFILVSKFNGKSIKGGTEVKRVVEVPAVIAESLKPENKVEPEKKQEVIVEELYILKKNHISFPNGDSLDLSGIFTDNKGAFVLIGPDMYKADDKTGKFIIKEITMTNVKVEYKGKIYDIPT